MQVTRSVPSRKKGGKRLQIQQHKTHGKPRGVMAAAMLLAVSAAVIAGVTFGWYDFLRETQAGAVVLNSEGQDVNVDGFTIIASNKASSDVLNRNTITLKSYDSVFGKNSETPVYILIPVSGQAVQEENHTLSFTFDCGNGTLVNTDTNMVQPYFSNVAQLRCVTVAGEPADYADARAQFSGVTDPPECFANFTVDSETHAASGTKRRTVPLSAPGYSATGVQYVLFELDYNFDLVTRFVDNHANDISGRLDQSQNLEFSQDTIHITVSAD